MKDRISGVYRILTAILLLTGPAVRGQDIDALLRKWDQRLAQPALISCRIRQRKRVSLIRGHVSLAGKLYFMFPRFFRMEMKGDENFDLYCDGEKIHIIDHDLEEEEVILFQEWSRGKTTGRLAHPLAGMTKEEILRSHEIVYDASSAVYVVTPKDPVAGFRTIRFKVDTMDRIKWMMVLLNNGDWTETEFSRWRKHKPVSTHFFRYLKKSGTGEAVADPP